MTMLGFPRTDGRKGIRNTVVVGYLVECAHHVAREIAIPLRDRDVHVIGFPGCYPNSYAETMMERLCTHPNVGAVLLVSLGCEQFNRQKLMKRVEASGRPVELLVIQKAGPWPSSFLNTTRSTRLPTTRARKMTKVLSTPWMSASVTMSPLATCATS